MRKLIIVLLSVLAIAAKGQTWDEFFKQKKTQRKYLAQQIAAFELYAGYVKKGYEIANHGINSIKGLSQGEFDLHDSFFKSLEVVSPVAVDKSKIRAIVACQLAIHRTFKSLSNNTNHSLTTRSYIRQVREKVLRDCESDIELLLLAITDRKLDMEDNERINRVNQVYESMKDKYQFAKSFSSQIMMLDLQINNEESDTQFSRRINGIIN